MNMLKRFGFAVVLLSAMTFTATGCTMLGMGGDSDGVKMSGKEHKEAFPKGHTGESGKNCYYDRVNDTFLCEFNK